MNTILNMIPCVMGLPAINDNLVSLLNAMAEHPANLGLGIIMTWAKAIGLCIALGVGANECFQMMLGRRGMDVMKILHIIIISLCITFAGSIANMACYPGKALTAVAKSSADGQNAQVQALEEEVAGLQEQYLKKVREHLQQLEENKEAQNKAEADGIIDEITNAIDEVKESIGNRIKEFTILAETKLCEWINLIIRFIGEVLFQVAFYGIMVCQAIFMHILAAFAPLMFAISLSPHYKSAWSQWLSKYISVTLWGFVAYICLYYVGYIMEWSLEADKNSYMTFMADLAADSGGDVQVGAIGMQAIGTTCMYVVGLLVGVRAIAFVPEVASWLIPGGVASGAGASAAGAATSAASMAQSGTMIAASGVGAAAGMGASAMGAVGNYAYNQRQKAYSSYEQSMNGGNKNV